MSVALHVLRYFKGTMDLGLNYSDSLGFSITAYSDNDWATCPNTRKSVTGCCIFLVVASLVGSLKSNLLFHYLLLSLNIGL